MKKIAVSKQRRLSASNHEAYIVIREQEHSVNGWDGDRRRKWSDIRVTLSIEELREIIRQYEDGTLR